MAAGAVGASIGAFDELLVDEMLGCRPEVLGRRSIEPERLVLLVLAGAATREVPPPGCTTLCLSDIFLSAMCCESNMLPVPVGEGN